MVQEGLRLRSGPHQFDVADKRSGEHEVNGAITEHLVGEAQVAAQCVFRLRHELRLRALLPPGRLSGVKAASYTSGALRGGLTCAICAVFAHPSFGAADPSGIRGPE